MPKPKQMTEEQLAKLPKYARDEIERLRRRVGELRARIADVPEDDRTRVYTDVYADLTGAERPRPVARDRQPVRFYLTPERDDEHSLDAMIRDDRELDISAYGGTLALIPSASNSVKIRVIRR